MSLKIFVTGFSPFAGAKVNPAWEAVKRLPGEIAGADIVRLQIPVAFVRDGEVLRDAIRSYRPDAVLCVGQAGGRAEISVERIAVNLMDSAIPDNDGVQPADMPICPHGKSAYFSTLPVKGSKHPGTRNSRFRFQYGRHLCLQRRDVPTAFHGSE